MVFSSASRSALVTFAAVVVLLGAPADALGADDLDSMTVEELESEKLREEIRQLRDDQGWQGLLGDFAPLGTVVIGLAGAFLAVRRFRHDRATEAIRRTDERFAKVAADLGSDNVIVSTGAAVALRSFFKAAYARETRDEAFALLCANLKIRQHPRSVRRLLVGAFEEALKVRSQMGRSVQAIDLTDAWLEHGDLQRQDLSEADLAWSKLRNANLRWAELSKSQGLEIDIRNAVLSDANLHYAEWQKAHGEGAYFHNTRMASIDLKHSNLEGALFEGALLSSAHLQDCDLAGANFTHARIGGAHFEGARFDAAALKTLASARSRQTAYFDPGIKQRIDELAERPKREPEASTSR